MEEININLEDLEESEPPPSAAGASPGDEGLLVIESEDLADVAPLPTAGPWKPAQPATQSPALPYGPNLPAAVPGAVPAKGSFSLSQVAGWGLLQMALAGAIGGFLAWACVEPFTRDEVSQEDPATILLQMAAFGSVLGGLIGAALGSVPGLSARVADKALRGAGLGLLIGGAGGAMGGLFGQLLYGGLVGEGTQVNLLRHIAVRAIAWALVGVFVGLGQGALGASPRRLVNGLLGGAIGGFVGGFLFDPLGVVVSLLVGGSGPHAGWLSRMTAMVVMGACSGAAIGLVEELRKEAWLTVAAGPLTGKQFILYRLVTTIGSSPKADICLVKDPAILPQHAVLQQSGQAHLLLASPEAVVAVNGRPATRRSLHSGDRIALGQTVLEYRLKAVGPGPP